MQQSLRLEENSVTVK